MKRKVIVANWKMNKWIAETKSYIHGLKSHIQKFPARVLIATPFTSLYTAAKEVHGSEIEIGAQNVGEASSGAFTGEVSASMIVEAGGKFVLIGHSERRRLYHETDEVIENKVAMALKTGLKVILCVGESKEERDAGLTKQVIEKQLKTAFSSIGSASSKVMIAYEPLWAIGTGDFATPNLVEEIHLLCKNILSDRWSVPQDTIKVLYGGSVNAKNAREYLQTPFIDGLLVGGASLELDSFIEIVEKTGVKS